METKKKQAWILHTKKIVSFHEVPGAEFYEADDADFWKYIFHLVEEEYKIQ